jgi:hypothetical protein
MALTYSRPPYRRGLEDGWFPSLVDLFLCHGGSLETMEELIRGIKERTKEELEHWGLGRSASGAPHP